MIKVIQLWLSRELDWHDSSTMALPHNFFIDLLFHSPKMHSMLGAGDRMGNMTGLSELTGSGEVGSEKMRWIVTSLPEEAEVGVDEALARQRWMGVHGTGEKKPF